MNNDQKAVMAMIEAKTVKTVVKLMAPVSIQLRQKVAPSFSRLGVVASSES